ARERVFRRERFESDLGLAGPDVDGRDVAQHLARSLRGGHALRHRRVEIGQALQELLHRGVLERRWDEALDGDILELEREPGLTREDDGLAGDVRAREVIARIGLRVALRFGFADDFGKRPRAVEQVEQIRERAREDAADAADLVAGLNEVFQCVNDGQARADGRLVEEVRASAVAQALQLLVILDRPAMSALVRRDDVDTALQPRGIAVRDTLIRGAVDEHCVRQVIGLDVRDEPVGVDVDADRLISHIQADYLPHAVLIDCTADQGVADRYAAWLQRGIHVITPNKRAHSGPIEYYQELKRLSHGARAHFLYEATVGAGLPVIHTLKDLVETADEIRSVSGIFSGTL